MEFIFGLILIPLFLAAAVTVYALASILYATNLLIPASTLFVFIVFMRMFNRECHKMLAKHYGVTLDYYAQEYTAGREHLLHIRQQKKEIVEIQIRNEINRIYPWLSNEERKRIVPSIVKDVMREDLESQ